MSTDTLKLMRSIGLSDKAAQVYLAAVELGESSVLELARHSHIKRSTIYYLLNELQDAGALIQVSRGKKIRYVAELPRTLIERAQDRLSGHDSEVEQIGAPQKHIFNKPHIYFLHGPQGFKKIWDMIFASPTKEFSIITNGKGFLDFVKEKYIIDHIINTKKKRGFKSRQLIVTSSYARSIVAKDLQENRQSRYLPEGTSLPFTEVITEKLVAFISPRFDNTLFVVEHTAFAETRQHVFDQLWKSLPPVTG